MRAWGRSGDGKNRTAMGNIRASGLIAQSSGLPEDRLAGTLLAANQ